MKTPEEAKQVKLDVNKSACKMLGLILVSESCCLMVNTEEGYEDQAWEFDIFTNPEDALDVVIALGDEYGIAIMPAMDYTKRWFVRSHCGDDSVMHDSHIDALSAAIQAIGSK